MLEGLFYFMIMISAVDRSLMLCFPIISQVKNYPFEDNGVVLPDHLLSPDWHARNAQAADRASREVLAQVRGKQGVLLG